MKSVSLEALPHFRLLDIWFGYTLKLCSIIEVHKFLPFYFSIWTLVSCFVERLSFNWGCWTLDLILETLDLHLLFFLKLNLNFCHAYFVFEFFFNPHFGHMFWNKFEFFWIVNSYFVFEFSVLYRERIVNKNGICTENSSREKKKDRKRKEITSQKKWWVLLRRGKE